MMASNDRRPVVLEWRHFPLLQIFKGYCNTHLLLAIGTISQQILSIQVLVPQNRTPVLVLHLLQVYTLLCNLDICFILLIADQLA